MRRDRGQVPEVMGSGGNLGLQREVHRMPSAGWASAPSTVSSPTKYPPEPRKAVGSALSPWWASALRHDGRRFAMSRNCVQPSRTLRHAALGWSGRLIRVCLIGGWVVFASAYVLVRFVVGSGDGLGGLAAFVVEAAGEQTEQLGVLSGHPAAADVVVGCAHSARLSGSGVRHRWSCRCGNRRDRVVQVGRSHRGAAEERACGSPRRRAAGSSAGGQPRASRTEPVSDPSADPATVIPGLGAFAVAWRSR